MDKLNFRVGQTYICTKKIRMYKWTVGKEYSVVLDTYGRPALPDNNGNTQPSHWFDLLADRIQLELKLDINELTKEQLKEYNSLIEDKEKAESRINDFIEKIKN